MWIVVAKKKAMKKMAYMTACSRFISSLGSASRLILLGPPCCGKGTLAQRLVVRYSLPHISTGEIFRSHLSNGTPFGDEIRQSMQEGKLISDHLVTNLVLKKLRTVNSGFILDGFPRTLPQAEELHRHFDRIQAIHLNVDDETVLQRLSGRLSCGSCGSVFNLVFCPPKEEGRCDGCGEALVQRLDDTLEVAIERLRNYHEQSEPLIKYYQSLGVLTSVETKALLPDQIFRRVIGEI